MGSSYFLAVVPENIFLEAISIDGNVSRQALKILTESLIDQNWNLENLEKAQIFEALFKFISFY